jgi:hypothetical protein
VKQLISHVKEWKPISRFSSSESVASIPYGELWDVSFPSLHKVFSITLREVLEVHVASMLTA